MATRGIVAERLPDGGWQGRYVHWDNYPERITQILGYLVERDGVAQVQETIIRNNAEWSVLDPFMSTENKKVYPQEAVVDGYGIIYPESDINNPRHLFRNTDSDSAWCEYLYIIDAHDLEVHQIVGNNGDQPIQTTFIGGHLWKNLIPSGV